MKTEEIFVWDSPLFTGLSLEPINHNTYIITHNYEREPDFVETYKDNGSGEWEICYDLSKENSTVSGEGFYPANKTITSLDITLFKNNPGTNIFKVKLYWL